jgi:hypothetical protein
MSNSIATTDPQLRRSSARPHQPSLPIEDEL